MAHREMDFNDMLRQFRMVKKVGSGGIQNVIKMIPGLGAQLPDEALNKANDREVSKIEAIILSMTPAERRDPDILDVSRRVRIAAGSGTSLAAVADLIGRLYAFRRPPRFPW